MIIKQISYELSTSLFMEMVNEVKAHVHKINKDATSENKRMLNIHANIFMEVVEGHLCDTDKLIAFEFAYRETTQLLMERPFDKKMRQTIHRWSGRLYKRIAELKELRHEKAN